MIQVSAQQRQIAFYYRPDPDLPRAVYGDDTYLSQVLINLLNNAVKFTQEGRVFFRVQKRETRSVNRDQQEPDSSRARFTCQHRLRFEVEDTGIGIPADKLDAIFSPFVQVEQQTRKIEGAGLGLAISRELVRLLGGELQVKSVVNQGSIFWFEMDLYEVSETQVPGTPQEKQICGFPGKPRKVLIVDDSRENRMVLIGLLAPLGFELKIAENGTEALQRTMTWKPDMILLDIIMPDMDGYTVARKIRHSTFDIRNIPIIAISASTSASSQQKTKTAAVMRFSVNLCRQMNCLRRLGNSLN